MQQALRRRVSPSILIFAAALIAAMAAITSTASAALPGYDRVIVLGDSNSFDKGVKAECPAGLKVIGAGGQITGGSGDVVLEDVIPDPALRTVTVNAREKEGGTSRNWRVRAIAFCAKPLPGLKLVSKDSAFTSANQSAKAVCPVGMTPLGSGAEITSFGGTGQVMLDQINPNSDGVFAFAREDRNGFAGTWSVTAHAICALPVGQKVVRRTEVSSSTGSAAANVSCPSGTNATGGGFDSKPLGSGGEAIVETFGPNLSGVTTTTRPDQLGLPLTRLIEAVAICA